MGPTRNSKSLPHGEASSNKSGSIKQRVRKNQSQTGSGGVPGVQKLKSSLRQTRRLLAKDNLAADVRVETERRLKTLEADLVKAELAKRERSIAVRYHKVKFFERQKVVRKLNQTKKKLASVDSSLKAQLESAVFELRVDLNYILHYPKTKKYISLFPPEIRENVTPPETTKVNPSSEEVRNWIRERMEAGELSPEPELDLKAGQDTKSSNWDWKGDVKSGTGLGNVPPPPEPEKDAFFEDSEDEDSESE